MEPAKYTFLPWLRQGIVGQATSPVQGDNQGFFVPLQLTVRGKGESEVSATIDRQVKLYGPKDITGINRQAIIRTVPRAGVRDFEANFLAAIEFFDEDFPWRYTPKVPVDGQLAPWLWLVVLTDEEFVRKSMTGILPTIEITPNGQRAAFPPPETTGAWAHTQLNFEVSKDYSRQQAHKKVKSELEKNPNLGCSRLLCPRRLKPETHYTAFLVPAFEGGRLAGLGRNDQADRVPTSDASWPSAENVTQPRLFPIYYEWEFFTDSAGDFELLARRLQPLEPEAYKALEMSSQALDIQEPGWNIHYRHATGEVGMESALQTLQSAKTRITESQEAPNRAFVASLGELINMNTDAQSGAATVHDDPFVVPPLYGSYYRPAGMLNTTSPTTWKEQLNLNPVFRLAASQGAAVIQQHQETFMDRAWDQLGNYPDAHKADQHWELSLKTSQPFFAKRFDPILEQTSEYAQFRSIALTAPVHKMMRATTLGNTNFSDALRGPFQAVFTPSFFRITRTNGALMRRFDGKGLLIDNRSFRWDNRTTNTINFLASMVEKAINIRLFSTPFGGAISSLFESSIKDAGFLSFANYKEILEALLPSLASSNLPDEVETGDKFRKLQSSIRGQLNPEVTISARRSASVKLTDSKETTFAIPDPMYLNLAERSTDFILPGLEYITPNRAVLLESNPAFIESYMVGLNHEMSRELLWREYPAALDGTFFRHFWDVRDNPSGGGIAPISTWGTAALGTNQAQGTSANLTVIAIRGDLLRKYPDTEISLHQASWETSDKNKRVPAPMTSATFRPALFSARIEPDYIFIGFDVSPSEAVGTGDAPGWFFVLKERAGNVQFGLDMNASASDPSWPALGSVQENTCIDVRLEAFTQLPRYRGNQADVIARLLFQKPFMRYVHAGRLITLQ